MMKRLQKHDWKYNTYKVNEGPYMFSHYQVKTRAGRYAPPNSGFPVMGKLHWGLKGIQTYKKVKNGYLIKMAGRKVQKGYTRRINQRYIK